MAINRPSGAVSAAFAAAICCRSPLCTAPASLARASATCTSSSCPPTRRRSEPMTAEPVLLVDVADRTAVFTLNRRGDT